MSRKGGKKDKKNKKVHKNKWEKFSKADAVKSRLDAEESKPKPEPPPIRPTYSAMGSYRSRLSDPGAERVYNWQTGRYEPASQNRARW